MTSTEQPAAGPSGPESSEYLRGRERGIEEAARWLDENVAPYVAPEMLTALGVPTGALTSKDAGATVFWVDRVVGGEMVIIRAETTNFGVLRWALPFYAAQPFADSLIRALSGTASESSPPEGGAGAPRCGVCEREHLTAATQNSGRDLCPADFLGGLGVEIDVGSCWRHGYEREKARAERLRGLLLGLGPGPDGLYPNPGEIDAAISACRAEPPAGPSKAFEPAAAALPEEK